MVNYILDSNILVYSLEGRSGMAKILEDLNAKSFFASSISYFEVLVGAKKQGLELEEIKSYFDDFGLLIFDRETAEEAIEIQKENSKQLKFKDLAIAATARWNKLTLVTADRDFKSVKGLNVKLVKVG